MAYRNGTYVAFHANGTNYPIDSDIKYYNLLKAWSARENDCFTMNNSHDKTSAVRDSSSKETLKRSLRERLCNSKHMVLIIGETTKHDDDWIPFEIEYAVDVCKLPIIIAYLDYNYILAPSELSYKWPPALKKRIENNSVSAIHIPFKKALIHDAIKQFSHNYLPKGGSLGVYSKQAYLNWGIFI